MPHNTDVTRLLIAWSDGNESAAAPLMDAVYDELRRLARAYLVRERSDHSLQATALVHEAYLKLVDQRRVRWQNRAHFFAVAAQMMRRLLVDHDLPWLELTDSEVSVISLCVDHKVRHEHQIASRNKGVVCLP